MKKFTLTFALTIIIALTTFAQPPQAFKYQAVVRDNAGEILQNQNVGIRISIHDETTLGTIVYQETFSETTNNFGLVNLQIGNGTPTIGTFTGIDWGSNSKFLEIEIDPTGGSNYSAMGTSELLSVPYALYSERSKDAVWEKSGNDIFYNDGNVGIGKSNPTDKLEISGIDAGLTLRYDGAYSSVYGQIKHGNSQGMILNANAGGGGWADMRFQTNGDTKMFLESAGRLGLGTTEPWAGLHLKGNGYPNSFMFLQSDTNSDAGLRFYEGNLPKWHIFNSASNDALTIYNSNNTHTVFYAEQTSGNVGIGTTAPDATFHVATGTDIELNEGGYLILGSSTYKNIGMDNNEIMARNNGAESVLYINNEGGNVIISGDSDGKLGIGTPSPGATLDVNGHIWTSGTGRSVFIGEDAGISDDLSDRENVFIGYSSGKTNINGYKNTAVGTFSLSANTEGIHNTAFGAHALQNNINQSENTAVGYQSLYNNTYGQENTASGSKSLYSNDFGYYNTAVGSHSLYSNQGGSYNTGFGFYAFSIGSSFSNSCALGYDAQPGASNTVMLGNSSVTWIGGHSSWHNTSDARMKNNILEDVIGLDFIMELRPVTYYFDIDRMNDLIGVVDSSDYTEKYDKEKIKQSGFLAQEVEQAAQKSGYDFSGVCIPKGEVKYYSLAYAEFVVPLVKGMQEQQAMIEKQQEIIEELISRIEKLEKSK